MDLNEYLRQARKNGTAIGHFNFATEDVLKALVAGSKEAGASCVMAGTSEGEADFIGLKEAVAMTRAVAEDFQFPVFLNADHFKSFEKCKEAIDAGYDSVLIDGSKLEEHENISLTREVVEYARLASAKRRETGSVSPSISVEGELGYLRGVSEVQHNIAISPKDYTHPNQAFHFVSLTGVDRLAVVFGNIHGIVTSQIEKLDIQHLNSIVRSLSSAKDIYKRDVHLVLHGASGLSDKDVSDAIKAGIVNVHFNRIARRVSR